MSMDPSTTALLHANLETQLESIAAAQNGDVDVYSQQVAQVVKRGYAALDGQD